MLDIPTTITVNGSQGDRFLSSLGGYRNPVPRALRHLASGDQRSIQVDPQDAELVASFVEELLASGWVDVEQPLLFSPRVGDEVLVLSDSLAEVSHTAKHAPVSWRLVEKGTRGKLIGWRDVENEPPRAVLDLAGVERRLVVFIGETKVTRARRHRY
ncbi:MAG: hypothetical protein JO257_08765 [Deltaproteobacteria bacterium]|nr:hypothetical protein [Deltaproteobacteria bacterium]